MIEYVTGGEFREEKERARLHVHYLNDLDSIDCPSEQSCREEAIRYFHAFMKDFINSSDQVK